MIQARLGACTSGDEGAIPVFAVNIPCDLVCLDHKVFGAGTVHFVQHITQWSTKLVWAIGAPLILIVI